MLRFVRVYGVSSNESRVLYRVSKPRFISAYKYFNENFSSAFSAPSDKLPLVFNTSIAFNVPASNSADGRYYEAIVYVPENQPSEESVEEITSYGVTVEVYNEYGNLVCDNRPSSTDSTSSASTVTGGSGEMTSEPIDGPGEML